MQVTKTLPLYDKSAPRVSSFKNYEYIQNTHTQTFPYKPDNFTQLTMPTPAHSQIISDIYDSDHQYTTDFFTAHKKIPQLIDNFSEALKQVLQIIPQKYQLLSITLTTSYNYLKQILLHYYQQNHLDPYYYQMHLQSTDTKTNLLKLLTQQQYQKNILQSSNQQLKNELTRLNNIIKSKNNEINNLYQTINSLQKSIKASKDTIQKCQQQLLQKDKKLIQLAEDKEVMKKNLNQIQQQMNQFNHHQNPCKNKKKIKFIANNHAEQQTPVHQHQANSQELYRFLSIQSETIQYNILNK